MSKIEDEVCEEILARAERGLNKYGVSMERDDLDIHEWLQHLLEELLDAAVYVKRLQKELAPHAAKMLERMLKAEHEITKLDLPQEAKDILEDFFKGLAEDYEDAGF